MIRRAQSGIRVIFFSFAVGWITASAALSSAMGGPGVAATVRYGDGWPALGARVELIPLAPRVRASHLLMEGRAGADSVASGTVDEDGLFHLEAPQPGVFRVRVEAAGFLPMQWGPLVLAAPGPGESRAERLRVLAPLTLERAVRTRVQALDERARPLAGALVWASSSGVVDRSASWRPDVRLVAVDAAGRAVLPRAPGEVLDVSLIGAGGRVETRRQVLDPVVRLRLPAPSAAVRRTVGVSDPQGRPLPGVIALQDDLGWPIGVTDADGKVALLTRPGSGTPLLLVAADGRERAVELEALDTAPARPAKSAAPAFPIAHFELPRPVWIETSVVDAATRRPLAGAIVWPGTDPGAWARTGADGRVRLAAPRAEGFSLQAEAEGWRPRRVEITREVLAAARRSFGPARVELAPIELLRAVRLAGRVLDADGRPIAGVHLAALSAPAKEAPPEGERAVLRFDPAVGRAHSDARGRFQVGGLTPGEAYALTAFHPGYAGLRVELRAPEVSADGLELVMRPARTVHGRVVDHEERPLKDAVVVLTRAGSPLPTRAPSVPAAEPAPHKAATRFHALSNGEGRFAGLRVPSQIVDLTVFREGFMPTHVRGLEIPAVPSSDVGTVLLQPGLGLRGRVLDETGEGLAGVRVHLLRDSEDVDQLLGAAAEEILGRRPAAETGADGRFRVAELRRGESLHALFERRGYQVAWRRYLEIPISRPLEVQLEPAAIVGGRVIDEAGEGVVGASVVLAWSEPLADDLPRSTARVNERERLTGADGGFTFDDAAPGRVTLAVRAEGYVVPDTLILEPGEDAEREEIVIPLEAGATLEGRIRTASGHGVAGAWVRSGGARALSDAEGLYRMSGVPMGEGVVEVRHPRYGRRSAEVEIENGINTHDVIFEDGYRIRGHVVDASGEAVSGAVIQLRATAMENPRYQNVISAADGSFAIGPIVDGEYRLELDKEGFVSRPRFTEVRVSGAAIDDLRLVMAAGAVVRGRVLGLDYDRRARVRVEAEAAGERSHPAVVDYEGRFEIRGLAPGEWLLRASLEGGRREARERLSLPAGVREARLDLEFASGLRLSGRVRQDEEPIAGASLTLRGLDLAVRRNVLTDHQGRFLVEDLEAGRYRLEMTHARLHLVYNRDVELSADRDLDLHLRPARLAGQVRAEGTSQPVADALVWLARIAEGGGEESLLTAATDGDGAFSFPRVPAGRYRLSLRKDGYAAEERELVVEPSARHRDLEVVARATAGLRLLVRAEAGPPPHVTVAVSDAGGAIVLREVRVPDEDGIVSLATVAPGRWQIVLTAPGHAPARLGVEVPAAGGEPVAVPLEPASRLQVRVPALAGSEQIARLRLYNASGIAFSALDELAMPRRWWPVVAGRTVVEHVPRGAWTLVVEAPQGGSWSGTVELGEAGEVSIELP